MEIVRKLSDQKGFNRYMVECEYALCDVSSDVRTVLIDTWWNVNYIMPRRCITQFFVLIDTWWNVN